LSMKGETTAMGGFGPAVLTSIDLGKRSSHLP